MIEDMVISGLKDGFRVFINPTDVSDISPDIALPPHNNLDQVPQEIWYTNGSCLNNGNLDAKARAGVLKNHENPENEAIRVPPELPQTNNSGEVVVPGIPGNPESKENSKGTGTKEHSN
ncbi:hypothetical protein BDQ17DRAFT_1327264 [Cyathus striatus]|nr:hypothetical protein BDQ17DRAFT_1327264 [Cyathus striatus]